LINRARGAFLGPDLSTYPRDALGVRVGLLRASAENASRQTGIGVVSVSNLQPPPGILVS
jgi:hypothetical protein